MTPAQTHAHGLVIPSSPQQWLGAMLRAFVELVLYVVSTFWMRPSRLPAECHSDVPPQALPGKKSDTQEQETASVAASDDDDDPMIIITSGSGSLIRVPREGGDPAIISNLVQVCSFKAEQASPSALDPRLRGGCGRDSSSNPAPA